MRIRYFFTNKRDSSTNNFVWQDSPRPLRIQDVRLKLLSLGVTDANSHLRFLDKINGEKVWLDIINDDVECPSNSSGVVDIKIVQQFHCGSQAFLSDVFGPVCADSYSDAIRRLKQVINWGGLGQDSGHVQPGQEIQQTRKSGYMKFESEEEMVGEKSLETSGELGNGVTGDLVETEELNEDLGKFDIKFDESQVEEKPAENIDFLNDTVDPSFVPKTRTDSKEMGEFANLMDSDIKATPGKPANPPDKEGILNLDLGQEGPSPSTGKTAHEIQIDEQQQKLKFANEIDPIVTEWSKDPSTGTTKDIRSLLISLNPFLKKFNIDFEKIMLSQVMSKGAVRKMYFKVIRRIHPDKTNETDPKILYMFERMTEIINNAFKKHKSMA